MPVLIYDQRCPGSRAYVRLAAEMLLLAGKGEQLVARVAARSRPMTATERAALAPETGRKSDGSDERLSEPSKGLAASLASFRPWSLRQLPTSPNPDDYSLGSR